VECSVEAGSETSLLNVRCGNATLSFTVSILILRRSLYGLNVDVMSSAPSRHVQTDRWHMIFSMSQRTVASRLCACVLDTATRNIKLY